MYPKINKEDEQTVPQDINKNVNCPYCWDGRRKVGWGRLKCSLCKIFFE